MNGLSRLVRLRNVVLLYVVFTTCFALMKLDGDEISFVRDPYEMLGGDYTRGYLAEGEYGKAVDVARRAYYFYWKYRPINAPVIAPEDRTLFAEEEARFGYRPPATGTAASDSLYQQYSKRLIVPEPERFWVHSAGKPLLNALCNLPSLGLVLLATRGGHDLLYYQFNMDYHPVFILVRLVPLLSGLLSILLVHRLCRTRYGEQEAVFAAALVGLFPISITYFANIHHDALMVPFAIGTAVYFARRRYVPAGIAFGLALASKNSAIFLLFPAGMLVAKSGWEWLRGGRTQELRGGFLGRMRGAILLVVLGTLVLTPFANPWSYALEILTPVIDRPHDPQGLLFKGAFEEASALGADSAYTVTNRFIYIFKSAFPFHNSMLLVILCIPMLWVRVDDDLERFAFWMLVALFPYSLAFSHQLGYRSLFLLPFFAILAARSLTRHQLGWIVGGLLVLDLVFCVNPIATGSPRLTGNGKSLIQSVASGFR